MRSLSRHKVRIALVFLGASIALVVLWASTRTVANDAVVVYPRETESDATTQVHAELEAPEADAHGVRTAGLSMRGPDASLAEFAPTQQIAERCEGALRVRLVDAENRPVTGVTGTFELRSDLVRTTQTAHNGGYGDSTQSGGRHEPTRIDLANVVEIPWSGEYVFHPLAQASFKLECRANGYRRTGKSVNIPSGDARVEIELVLIAQRSFDVSLRTPDGGSFIAALRKLEPSAEKLLRPQLDEHEPDLRGSGFVPFCTSRRESTDDAYWQTFAANTHASLTLTLFLNEVPIASERAIAGLAQMQVVVPLETVIDVISARQSITGFNEPK